METRRYTIISDNSIKYRTVELSAGRKSFLIIYESNDSIKETTIKIDKDELIIENVVFSNDMKTLYANVLYVPNKESDPDRVTLNFNQLVKNQKVSSVKVDKCVVNWCGTKYNPPDQIPPWCIAVDIPSNLIGSDAHKLTSQQVENMILCGTNPTNKEPAHPDNVINSQNCCGTCDK